MADKMVICETCGKEFETEKQLRMHKLGAHRRKPASAQPQPEQSPEPEQPNLADKLGMLGISLEDVSAALNPLIETSVVRTLEKMQLGEAINKKLVDIETKLRSQVESLVQELQPARALPSDGDNQPVALDNSLRDSILKGVAQKFLSGDSGGSLDALLAQQTKIGQLVESFTKPYRDAEEATLKRVDLIMGIGKKAGKSPEDTYSALRGGE